MDHLFQRDKILPWVVLFVTIISSANLAADATRELRNFQRDLQKFHPARLAIEEFLVPDCGFHDEELRLPVVHGDHDKVRPHNRILKTQRNVFAQQFDTIRDLATQFVQSSKWELIRITRQWKPHLDQLINHLDALPNHRDHRDPFASNHLSISTHRDLYWQYYDDCDRWGVKFSSLGNVLYIKESTFTNETSSPPNSFWTLFSVSHLNRDAILSKLPTELKKLADQIEFHQTEATMSTENRLFQKIKFWFEFGLSGFDSTKWTLPDWEIQRRVSESFGLSSGELFRVNLFRLSETHVFKWALGSY